MKTLFKMIPVAILAMTATATMAQGLAAGDVKEAFASTTSKQAVNYSCQNGKKVRVTYGFNKQGLPTYAMANVNGKTRTMPINLGDSGGNMTVFGEENSYILSADAITKRNARRSSMMITGPDNVIEFKGCRVR
ncbi:MULTISPECIES: adhesin [unclassified Acinetobacter]|uniref:ACP-like domain-containing protein n=1 Tax=unclassified Acinetobacter TaxID=196816 RepID=UPI0035B88E19